MQTTRHDLEPEELMAYVDRDLSPERAHDVAEHLARCLDCQEIARELQRVSARLGAWRIDEDSRATAVIPERIEARLSRRPRTRVGEFIRFYRWPVFYGSLLLLLVALVPFREVRQASDWEMLATVQSPRAAYMLAPAPQAAAQSVRKARLPGEARSVASAEPPVAATGLMIVRTAELSITTRDFANSRSTLGNIVQRYSGFISSITATAPENGGRALDSTIRVPSGNLGSLLDELRKLGAVEQESQSGNNVTKSYVDLDARLRNAQNTEQRLLTLQRERTARLSDVLAVETEISRVRGEIEQMEAESRNLINNVEMSTVHLTITEDFKAQLKILPRWVGGRLTNAAIQGYESLAESLIDLAEILLEWAPRVVLWGGSYSGPAA